MSTKPSSHPQSYSGYAFTVTDRFKFRVEETEREYDSYDQMTKAIDRLQTVKARTKKKPMSIAVILEDGSERTVTGVHLGTGKLIFSPPWTGWRHQDIYPNSPTVKAAIEKRLELQVQLENVQAVLGRFTVLFNCYRSSGPEGMLEQLQKFEADCDAKAKKANKTTFDDELRKAQASNKD